MRQGGSSRLVAFVPSSSFLLLALLLFCQLLAVGCSNNRKPAGPTSLGVPIERGIASWYGPRFHGRKTASGERYNMNDLTAAHPSLPFGTKLGVRNTRTGREVLVRVNDRGPFARNRVIDLSYAAAREVGVVAAGTASVELYLVPAAGAPPRYTVQVGAFSEPERALALQRDVLRLYPEAVVDSDGTWNRVQIGAFDHREEAESLRRELTVIGVTSVVVSAR
ncbi:MAG TPA: septal ring lytic transglycosylase RlpA family protein [Thermoanaerobaculia bacterium]|nr:septal ring lytic transglycosylase RlpA family protein [Thermoanaerobaculia bacterium]